MRTTVPNRFQLRRNFGYATNYDGVNDYFAVAHNAALESASATWSFWFKHDYASFPLADDGKGLLWKAANTGFARSFASSIIQADGTVEITIGNTAGNAWAYSFATTDTYQDNNWHHLVVVKQYGASVDTFRTYVDGVLKNETVSAYHGYQGTADLEFGRISMASFTTRYLKGQGDDIRIWNVALTAAEVTQLYNTSSSDVNDIQTANLTGWWKMDENTGTTPQDSSGIGNHGAFGAGTAAPTWTTGVAITQRTQVARGARTLV